MTKNSLLAEATFKDAAPEIAIHLANIINLSIKLVTFPLQCKIAKRKTLFKIGIKTEAKNYRPISLLPFISKVIEKFIQDQTQDYLPIRLKTKSFCKNDGKRTGMILIDLLNTFDILDHKI